MKPIYVTSLMFAALVSSIAVANAQTCSGAWGGQEATSIAFESKGNVRYCYLGQCATYKYAGDPKRAISFTTASGAVVKARVNPGGYTATWQGVNNRTAGANLRCR